MSDSEWEMTPEEEDSVRDNAFYEHITQRIEEIFQTSRSLKSLLDMARYGAGERYCTATRTRSRRKQRERMLPPQLLRMYHRVRPLLRKCPCGSTRWQT